MSAPLRTTTALPAKGIPFDVSGGEGSSVLIARGMVRASGIRADPFDVPTVARRAVTVIAAPMERGGDPPSWTLGRLWSLCSMEIVVPLSFLFLVASLLARRLRWTRKEADVTGVPSSPYGSSLTPQELQ